MQIKSLVITRHLLQSDPQFIKVFDFNKNTLIHSEKNSVGKTTLLRAILYAMGFSSPSTKGLKFKNYTFQLTIITDTGKELHLERENNHLILKIQHDTDDGQIFSLPADRNSIHSYIFENDRLKLLENILGVMYVDQEKGWTLLNRGIVIGKIRFSIESYIIGIAGIDCKDLENRLFYTNRQIEKYNKILNFAQYKNQIAELTPESRCDSEIDEIESKIHILEFERQSLLEEQKKLKRINTKNISFERYITSMKLVVQNEEGIKIPVNEKTILDFRDYKQLVNAKISNIQDDIDKISNKISDLYKPLENQQYLFEVESLVQRFDRSVSKINIDPISVKNLINTLENEKKSIEGEIKQKIVSQTSIIEDLKKTIKMYAEELDVYTYLNGDIFTSDLQPLSGAILHKIVFCFKLAYIEALRKSLDIKVPIILDSPRGKEVDEKNIEQMINILKRDFSNHQIIIASIYKYQLDELTTINIENTLLGF